MGWVPVWPEACGVGFGVFEVGVMVSILSVRLCVQAMRKVLRGFGPAKRLV